MKPVVAAIRAVGVEFANRIFIPVAIVTILVSVLLIVIIVWLTSMSGWWWILATLLIAAMSIALLGLILARAIIKWACPPLSRDQKKQTKSIVDKLQVLSETTQTPTPFLLFLVVRDIAFPKESGFIATLSHEASSIKHDFIQLVQSFRK